MALPQPPFDIVADGVVDTIAAFPWADYLDGGEDEPLPTVRHWRGTYADEEERPAILVRVDADEPNDADVVDQFGVYGELRMNLAISLVIDDNLETAISERDKTGLGRLGGFATLAMRALKQGILDETSPIGRVAENVQEAGRGPDADNSSDEGRLVQSIVVGYRVLDDDPTVLLHRGVNA